jgi:hypothetical protein
MRIATHSGQLVAMRLAGGETRTLPVCPAAVSVLVAERAEENYAAKTCCPFVY